ncbi:hypothetical protein [Thermoflexibacter ruber]|uniref:SpoIIAA-like n=1 Tax=Thermoflexibacter ruber TaxID=1003 RepID=A0A1I2JHZ1_9BACT|nr:hypothetical protein [Thermoflexibacter ruber]SFF52436.1 hypothetical protein SAMN04488541_10482 [Thermoflexibacter ruber]
MQLLYDGKYIKVYIYPDLSLMTYHWKPANFVMTEEEYQNTMLTLLQFLSKHKPKYVIADFRESEFVVIPSLQVWLSEHIIKPAVQISMKKLFLVLRKEDLIQELSLEQILEEAKDVNFQSFTLHSIDTALEYVKAKQGMVA